MKHLSPPLVAPQIRRGPSSLQPAAKRESTFSPTARPSLPNPPPPGLLDLDPVATLCTNHCSCWTFSTRPCPRLLTFFLVPRLLLHIILSLVITRRQSVDYLSVCREAACNAHADHPSQPPTSVSTLTSCLLLAHGICFVDTVLRIKEVVAPVRLLLPHPPTVVVVLSRPRPFSTFWFETSNCDATQVSSNPETISGTA